MKFGIQLGPMFPPGLTQSQILNGISRQATTAQASGFEGVVYSHHFLAGPDSRYLQPVPMLGFVSAQCPGMWVRTMMLMAFVHPVDVAEQTATLDVLSGGRALVTAVQGYRAEEWTSFGIDRKSRGDRTREAVQAVRILWSGERVSFQGRFYNFDDVTMCLPPIQKPGPHLSIAADTLRTVPHAAELGDSWSVSPRHGKQFLRAGMKVFRETCAQRKLGTKGLSMMRELCVGETRDEADRTMAAVFEESYKRIFEWRYPGRRFEMTYAQFKEERAIVGDPADVAEEILAYYREFDLDEFLWFRHYHPSMDFERSLLTLKLFGAEVIPRLRVALAGKASTGYGRANR
jgi:alkanesulfonate monooxygenase SsuD/methylene tetrahydromethanopterin reductase-like flavin-dependent oxidoreductase (luciferase family)